MRRDELEVEVEAEDRGEGGDCEVVAVRSGETEDEDSGADDAEGGLERSERQLGSFENAASGGCRDVLDFGNPE
jgi:hypothetical protein